MYGDKMKYIIFEELGNCSQVPILFPAFVEHKEIAKTIDQDVVSAGFVNASLNCSGKSVSLGVKNREDIDTKIIRRHFGLDSGSEIHVTY